MKTWKDVIYYSNIIIRPVSIFADFIVHLSTKYDTQLNANFYITKYENTNFEINEPTKFHRTTKIGIHKNKSIHSIIQISHSNSMTNKKDILLHLYISTVLITVLSTVIYFTYFVPVFKYCYSDIRNLWTVRRAGGLAP